MWPWRAVGLVALSLLAVGSASQTRHWKSDRALWSHDVAVDPTSLRGWTNLTAAALAERNCGVAASAWHHASALLPKQEPFIVEKLCPVLERQGAWLIVTCGASVPLLDCSR